MLKNKVKLSKVNISSNPICDRGMDLISEGMMRNETLRVFTVADAQLTKAAIPKFSECIRNKHFLTKILLDNNRIGVDGARLLAEGITGN